MKKIMVLVLVLVSATLVTMGCGSDKKKAEAPVQKEMQNPHGNMKLVLYTAPEGWLEEKPSSSMRIAQYRWPGADGGEDAILAVFHFPGGGGSVDANLQRWYGQFKNADGSPITEPAEKKVQTINGLQVTEVYVTGTYNNAQMTTSSGGAITNKTGYAMLAAIAETEAGPWFFKATGPTATIQKWKPEFDAFVQTFHLSGGK